MHKITQPTPPRRPAEAPDAGLVQRAANGDTAAFEAIMRRHNQRLFRTARGILRSDAEAEDAVQEAWLHAWRAFPGFRGESGLSTWLVRITANEALGRLRRKGAQIIPLEVAMTSSDNDTLSALVDPPDRGPEQTVDRAQLRAIVEARIDLLPEAFRSVFVLRAIEEMSVEEVAEALAIPAATVRTRYFRARSLLRESLAQEFDMALGSVFGFAGARCDRIVANVMARVRAEGFWRKD
ncbi:RNA polymerase sigma factor [Amaricoccus sp.]|uniref:RNA polymerase sigma factor n=1 Tax=Amaricoccus sp. TaxID=1872485 RepID=UPI001B68D84F|nr:RNA polymerase sigma factor [Amaricoccus sp.]MBP7240758.1 RNA polymerase sigma factor [Amaricoccus sp.]